MTCSDCPTTSALARRVLALTDVPEQPVLEPPQKVQLAADRGPALLQQRLVCLPELSQWKVTLRLGQALVLEALSLLCVVLMPQR